MLPAGWAQVSAHLLEPAAVMLCPVQDVTATHLQGCRERPGDSGLGPAWAVAPSLTGWLVVQAASFSGAASLLAPPKVALALSPCIP